MIEVVRSEIENLAELLKVEVDLDSVIEDIEKEALHDAKEGLPTKDALKINTLRDVSKREVLEKALETASSKILVRFYANHKKSYSEEQKEIFLTFLLTNKIKRSLESSK